MRSELSLATDDMVKYFDLHTNWDMVKQIESTVHTFCQTQPDPVVMFLDIDNFRNVNILLGHDSGNSVLSYISNLLLECGIQIVSRVGGDKFVVFTKGKRITIEQLTRTICEKLDTPFFVNDRSLTLSASIGVAECCPTQLDESIHNAEIAMFEAKKTGSRSAVFFDSDIHIKSIRYAEILNTLSNSRTTKELQLFYQPEADLKTGKIVALESLMRLYNDKYGMISPLEFIPIAETHHIISQLGYWTIEKVCDFIKTLQSDHLDFGVISINISPVQLAEQRFIPKFQRILKEKNIDPHRIQIEITESTLANCIHSIIGTLIQLRNLGVSIALDDFGSTYSSLNYLAYLPVDIIKIDKSFIDDIQNNTKKQTIVKTLIDLSHSLGYQVVAEGIETGIIRDLLAELGCDMMQGYLLSPPIHQSGIKNFILQEIQK